MGIRITTWNVNGIRNPFGYQPWRDKKTFEGMFEILEADIVVFQETKIQRKDLRDDMVLVPGWDCYFSLPKHKKGYSGVVIYTRNATCAPIRAEEGITGVLTPPSTSTSFRDLPEEQQIGGYPSLAQLSMSELDPITLDSEGRCVILEFPAFVIVGTYCPAARDETRDDFRLGFLNVLDCRIRNMLAMGKRVILTGDLNISRSGFDTANAEATMRKNGMSGEEYVSTPSRRLFNHLLVGGKVVGERDEGREEPVMWDICRAFHSERPGMFTCWEQKVNARPGNHGSRIDYVLCSKDMQEWFCDSNIQEGLMGSDHCPVYAVSKDNIIIDGQEHNILDLMNPLGMFREGKRLHEYSPKNYLPMSGKLIPEFDKRRNIRDMFSRKPSLVSNKSSLIEELAATPAPLQAGMSDTVLPSDEKVRAEVITMTETVPILPPAPAIAQMPSPRTKPASVKRQKSETSAPPAKRTKSGPTSTSNGTGKGQKSLIGFFKPKTAQSNGIDKAREDDTEAKQVDSLEMAALTKFTEPEPSAASLDAPTTPDAASGIRGGQGVEYDDPGETVSPATSRFSEDSLKSPASKQSWNKLFAKPVAPMDKPGPILLDVQQTFRPEWAEGEGDPVAMWDFYLVQRLEWIECRERMKKQNEEENTKHGSGCKESGAKQVMKEPKSSLPLSSAQSQQVQVKDLRMSGADRRRSAMMGSGTGEA